MKRDAASGDSYDVTIIDEKGLRELSDDEKGQILGGTSGAIKKSANS